MRDTILYNILAEAENKLSNDIHLKRSFISHQERDLLGCWPSERSGREAELIELKAELQAMLDARSKLESLMLQYA